MAAVLVTQGIRLADLTPEALLHYALESRQLHLPAWDRRERTDGCRDTSPAAERVVTLLAIGGVSLPAREGERVRVVGDVG
jgi:hypothetical protein